MNNVPENGPVMIGISLVVSLRVLSASSVVNVLGGRPQSQLRSRVNVCSSQANGSAAVPFYMYGEGKVEERV